MYLALAVAGAAGALWLADRFALSMAQTAATLLPTVAGSYLSWASFRSSRPAPSAGPSLECLAEQLAAAVRMQWETEAGVRGLYDPRPLTVPWRAAPEHLVEEWRELRWLAEAGRGESTRADSLRWAQGPAELAGCGGQILQVFRDQVPTGRLVVLGEPGSGKTMLLVRLLLELTEHRDPGACVPVLFPLSSWDPSQQDLESWLAHRLTQDFEELAAPGPQTFGSMSRARALLAHRLILPLLDGLDELPARVRGQALDQINRGLPLGRAVVLSSRTAEYHQAAAPADGLPRKLAGAAGIELLPLAARETAAYLRRDAGGAGTPAARRWDRVLHGLRDGGPVADALSTPLTVFLARTVYNPRTGEPLEAVPSPDELLDAPALTSRAAVEAHLFAAFVPAAYRPHPRVPSPWSAGEAERALRWLARHAERVRAGGADLAWWQLSRAVPHWLPPVLIGILAAALEHGTAWVIEHSNGHYDIGGPSAGTVPSQGLLAGLIGGLAGRLPGGLTGASVSVGGMLLRDMPMYSDVWPELLCGFAYGFIGGLMGELTSTLAARRAGGEPGSGQRRRTRAWGVALLGGAVGAGYGYVHLPGWAMIVTLACLFGLAGGLAAGYAARPEEVPPAAGVRWSWHWGGLLIGLGGGLAVTTPALAMHFLRADDETSMGLAIVGAFTGAIGTNFLGSAAGAGAVAVYCLAGSIPYGIRGKAADLTQVPGPAALLARDHRTSWRIGWMTALAVGVVIGLTVWCASLPQLVPAPELKSWRDIGIEWVVTAPELVQALVTGALVGTVVGLAVAWNQTAWGPFTVARGYLALRRRLPRRLMAFLADAHQHRGVLRQAGAFYQFRHIELQKHLAAGEPGGRRPVR
ncbi:NACHT domain-containing protein [Streptomyces sp. NRRL F-5755]|uniref:NACHT domain-containing protein n=1 Tax=Streptomyces sp. NRRL F-5755 TaxID=1519475 RepID=UPI0006AFAABB|nr:NACHT domain-containing protein [Streptomyces sp. NRRL F-5755]